MASVDDRIVRMEFDNASFERKIASTMASLAQLDKALKFTGASKGLSDVSAAAGKVDVSSISQGIEGVSAKFLALSTIAITVLSNITTKAMQAGAQFIKSFTIDPVLDGFREFETNMGSIQTILANTASKGTNLDQVSAALDQLNVYSDKTIYNFSQMAKNIGTFTAAGVDLQTSVDSIKGIANLAALSGSTSEQASTAMYQLSQAIATGSVKLMDWNSVVNAGMGGQVFKSALFETAKAMGTLVNVPVDQTLEQWEDAGNSFRDSLQDGWITADVLTTTLAGFTGDMTKEMLLAKGFNDQQADAILRTAEIAKAAATEVKTFTQLIGTVKEAIGTGFADSFRIVIGDFNESKELFTGINNAIGGFVNKTADARNAILQGWKDMGGRGTLIDALSIAFSNLGKIIGTIKDAFREIFPPLTAERLVEITDAFHDFVSALTPSQSTLETIKTIFAGFFAALSIGWNVIKEGAIFIGGLAKSLLGLVAPEAVGFLTKLANGLVGLQASLVKGEGIKRFFEGLTDVLQKPIKFLQKVKEAIASVFEGFNSDTADNISEGFGRIGERFSGLKDLIGNALGSIFEPLRGAFNKVTDVLGEVLDKIKEWASTLGDKIAEAMKSGDFSGVGDALNSGLLVSIALLLNNFINKGLKIFISGTVGIAGTVLEQLSGSLGQLNKTMVALQTSLKANALLKIAGAIAILTASLLVLSMIDSVALSKALAAMAVGFAELMGTFVLFTKTISGPKAAASFTIMSAGLIALSTSMFILAAAAKLMSTMDWNELSKGLVGVSAGLGLMVAASKLLSKSSPGMIKAGIGLTAMATSLVVLGIAMKIFATMSWEELTKGLIGVGVGLGFMTAAMRLMPTGLSMVKTGAGLIGVAVAMGILAVSMKIMSSMSWEEMAKGLIGVGAGLVGIALSMKLMPKGPEMLKMSAALLIVGIALNAIATALKITASMSWEELAKGLSGLGAALLILAGAMQLMESGLPGAAAMIVMASAITILVAALRVAGDMSWEEIAKGLVTVAGAMLVVAGLSALLSEAIPFVAAFGAALLPLGAGFALLGAGVFLVAKGFEAFVAVSKQAAEALPIFLEVLAKSVTAFVKGLAEGVIDAVKPLIKAAPLFAKLIGKFIGLMIDQVIKLAPKLGKAIRVLIEEIFKIIREYAGEIVKTGVFIITKLLEGIEHNIGKFVHIAGEIITNFLDAMTIEIPRIKDSLVATITTALTQAAEALGEVAGTILFGIGVSFMEGFFNGVGANLGPIATFFGELADKVLGWIGDVLGTLVGKGSDLLSGLWNGIQSFLGTISNFFLNLGATIANWVGGLLGTLLGAGRDVIQGLLNGITEIWNAVTGFLGGIGSGILTAIGNLHGLLRGIGEDVMQGLWNGLKEVWERVKDFLSEVADKIASTFEDALDIFSPSRRMKKIGQYIMEGLHIGMEDTWAPAQKWLNNIDVTSELAKNTSGGLTKILSDVSDSLGSMGEFNPTITPVLDLTQVQKDAALIGSFIGSDKLTPSVSIDHANVIAKTSVPASPEVTEHAAQAAGDVSFTQVINAPERLSTADIYKQTRNQFTIAKEELGIV